MRQLVQGTSGRLHLICPVGMLSELQPLMRPQRKQLPLELNRVPAVALIPWLALWVLVPLPWLRVPFRDPPRAAVQGAQVVPLDLWPLVRTRTHSLPSQEGPLP